MRLPWLLGGVALGLVFLMAVILVKPIGVSTQFVIFDGIVWDMIDDSVVTVSESAKSGYESVNAYLNKSGGKYAKAVANPMNYSFVFVLAMVAGAFVSSRFFKARPQQGEHSMPPVWRDAYGDNKMKRYTAAFLAGVIVLYGGRLAGGCTSGHMMSGMMQTSISGFLFTAGIFLAAVPAALIIYRKAN